MLLAGHLYKTVYGEKVASRLAIPQAGNLSVRLVE